MGMGRRVAVLGELLLLLLAVIAPVVRGYPRTAEPVFGLRQLREHHVSDDGRRMTLDFAHDDPGGRRIEVNYDVTLAPHIRPRNTDDEEHLLSIVGSADGKMRLTFDSAEAAAAFAAELAEGDLLHGHYQDGPDEEAAVFPYHARVLASTVTQETLDLNIDIPTLTEVFINAKANVMVALAPEDQYLVHHAGDESGGAAQEAREETPPSTSHKGRRRQLEVTRRKLGGTFDWGRRWLDRNLQHISKLGEMVLGVMDMAVKLVNFALTGNLYGQMNQAIDLFEFNYDKAMKGPICGFNLEDNILPKEPESTPPFWGECRQCYAYSTVALRFEVVIEQYDVQKFVAMVDGAVDFNFLMDQLFIPSAGVNAPFRKLIKSIRTKDGGITVPLGSLQLTIGAYVPVSLGADMWVSGAATFGVDMSASATVKAGYRFVKAASPQHQMVGKVDWDFGGRGVRLLRWAGREVGVRLSLFPVVQLDISLGSGVLRELAYIGGPNLGLEASVSAMVTASNSSTAVVERTTGVEGAIGANITLRLGNDKNKDLLSGKGKVTPKGILSLKYDMGKDEVRFKPFSVPSGPRRLVYEDDTDYTNNMYIATDDDAYVDDMSVAVDDDMMDPDGYVDSATAGVLEAMEDSVPIQEEVVVDAPEPELEIAPGQLAGYEWARVGVTFKGKLERLKPEWAPRCSNEDLGAVVPPYLEATAVVINHTGANDHGNFFLDLVLTYSYGNTQPGDGGLGAFAAISQSVSRYTLWGPLPKRIQTACTSSPVNGILSNYNHMYPNISYAATTTVERIILPKLPGGLCDNGDKLIFQDTDNCLRILLERNTTTSSTSDSTRRDLDALSNEERRRKLGHIDRFPRILQQCAPPKPPTPSPTRPPTSPPPPTTAPTRTPSRTPTTAPSTAPTRSPSHAPTRQPSQVRLTAQTVWDGIHGAAWLIALSIYLVNRRRRRRGRRTIPRTHQPRLLRLHRHVRPASNRRRRRATARAAARRPRPASSRRRCRHACPRRPRRHPPAAAPRRRLRLHRRVCPRRHPLLALRRPLHHLRPAARRRLRLHSPSQPLHRLLPAWQLLLRLRQGQRLLQLRASQLHPPPLPPRRVHRIPLMCSSSPFWPTPQMHQPRYVS